MKRSVSLTVFFMSKLVTRRFKYSTRKLLALAFEHKWHSSVHNLATDPSLECLSLDVMADLRKIALSFWTPQMSLKECSGRCEIRSEVLRNILDVSGWAKNREVNGWRCHLCQKLKIGAYFHVHLMDLRYKTKPKDHSTCKHTRTFLLPGNISLLTDVHLFPPKAVFLVLVLLLTFKVKKIIWCVPGEVLLHSSKPVSFKSASLQSLQ